jgi:arylsulfatase
MENKPNIVLIFPDQHRADSMGCAGNAAMHTPNLDRLAAQGINYRRCYTQSPLCMPARASLVTGQYVHEHGTWANSSFPDRHGPSHIRNIRQAGYHTALVGTTHMWVHGRGHTSDHLDEMHEWGFDDVHELTGPLATANTGSPYTDYLEQKGLLRTHREYIIKYVRNAFLAEAEPEAPWDLAPCPLPTEDHLDSYTARKAAEWIKDYRGDKPFYLQVLFPGPHDPFDSPQEYRDLYPPESNPVGILDRPGVPVPPYVRALLRVSALDQMTSEDMQKLRSLYYGKISLIDSGIGRVLNALEERGLLDDTWIIYTSDHGEMLGDHGLLHKIVFYEGAVHVPLIIRPPGGAERRESHALVQHLDVTATLLDIAGAKPLEGSDGHSLLPDVAERSDAHAGRGVAFSEVVGFTMAMTDRHKLAVEARTQEPLELYDRAEDPREVRNVVNAPAYKAVQEDILNAHLRPFLKGWDPAQLDERQDWRSFRAFGRPSGTEAR